MELTAAIVEVNQPRSEYQLRAWVLGQHPTAPQQFKQCVIELHAAEQQLAVARLEQQKLAIQISRLRATGDELDALDADIKQLALEDAERAAAGQRREVEILRRIYAEIDHFTAEEIEADQAAYWDARLKSDVRAQLAAGGGANWAHLRSMDQAGMLQEFVLDVRRDAAIAEQHGVDVSDVLLGAPLPTTAANRLRLQQGSTSR